MKIRYTFSHVLSVYKALQKMFDPAIEGNPYMPLYTDLRKQREKIITPSWSIRRWAIR